MKKIISLVLVAVLALTAIGGTLAYFTDTDEATNVMTMGNVKIDMTEEERKLDENGNPIAELKEFEQNKLLMPIVGSAQDDEGETVIPADVTAGTQAFDLPAAENWVDKVVNVDNKGNQPAYVRVVMAFPAAFDHANSSEMMVHWNMPENGPDYWTAAGSLGTITKDGTEYNLYTLTYKTALEAGKTTAVPAITGLYMDKDVQAEQKTVEDAEGNKTTTIVYTKGTQTAEVAEDYTFNLYCFAQAVQTAGFATPDEAFAATFKTISAENHPF